MKRLVLFVTLVCTAVLQAATISVSPGSGTLKNAVTNAAAGDVLVLADGEYTESTNIKPTVALTIQAAEGAKPVLRMSGRFEASADITLQNLKLQCSAEAVRMVPGSSPYNLTVKDCELSGCPSYYIRVYNTDQEVPYINAVTMDNCLFKMGTGEANSAKGFYAGAATKQLKSLIVRNSTFDGGANGTGRFIYVSPGSNVEALEGTMEIDHCTFYNSNDNRGVYPANLDNSHITNCIFMNAEERSDANSFAVYGSNSYVRNCIGHNAPVKVGTGGSQANCSVLNPYFVDPANGNFQLFANSPAINAGTDGSTIGDPRWGVSDEDYDNSHDPYIPYKMPYSMAPTTSSVKVLWQMQDETEPTEAMVCYGTDSTNLNMQVTTSEGWNVAGEGYVHVVMLSGLQPNTRYYFTVGASATRRCPKISWTKTAPEAGTAFRIFTISDIHGNAKKNWSNMQDFICDLNCDIALMNGDFVSSKGNDRNWNNYYFSPGAQFLGQVPVISSAGNHETGDPRGLRWSSFYDYFHQFAHEGASEGDTIDPRGEAYFHFGYGNADVVVLNLNFDESSPLFMPGSRQYQWLDSVLNACTRPWIIVCHHVGIYTSGYHGQWSEEPKQAAPLLEKYAAAPYNKRIISLSGDDHSFEHLYKDGVHYLRPGCGRDANYDQQKQIKDYKYSMYYRRVSCFSTLDMADDASSIALTAYDSVGNPFYTYTFLLEGEVITPSVNFTVPATEVSAEDSITLRWFTFDPAGDATVSFYYSQTANATDVAGMTPIVTNLPGTAEKYMWHTRDIFPKGKYYLYAVVSSGGQTFMGGNTAVVNLLNDTTPPPAPTALCGYKQDGRYHLTWRNPTHLVHLDTLLTDFSGGVAPMEAVNEEGATMAIQTENGALRCDYSITAAWATAATDYVLAAATDMHRTPILTFRLQGNGTATSLRIVCKNKSAGHEDWWYTEQVSLSSSQWQTVMLDLRSLQAFDWYANTDDRNQCEGIIRLSFGVSTGNAVSGTFRLDDLHVTGDIYPAPDYTQTVIVRNDNAFPTSPADGTEIYRGTAETCTDASSVVGHVYYYAAFAADDRDNWSAPDEGAQWKSEDVPDGIDQTKGTSDVQKFLHNGQLYIRKAAGTYTILGQELR